MQSNSRIRTMMVVAAVALITASCGRPASEGSNALTAEDVAIAGVSVTSPDAVVAPAETVAGTTASATTTLPPAGPTQKLYTIQPGDTMSGIASDHGIAIDDLARANGISDVNSLQPGDELVIPIPAPVDVTVVSTPESTATP